MRKKTLLAIMPHPDDESLALGGTLAKYGESSDVETHLITVTRGRKGNLGDPKLGVTRKMLPQVREEELRCAAKALKIHKLEILNYEDGELPAVDETIAITDMIRLISKIKPQVIITYGPDGGYGHPDHIAVCSWVTQAVKSVSSVKKLYYYAIKKDLATMFMKHFGKINLNGEELEIATHPQTYIDVTLNCRRFVGRKFAAIRCHQTQKHDGNKFELLRRLGIKSMILEESYHLAFTRGNFKTPETDLFTGL